VKDENEEGWMGICRQIATEQDPKRFVELITELNRLLDKKRNSTSSGRSREKRAPGS
jgi:hypothetical protein